MFSEQIEKLKSEYTEKYVIVHSDRPEFARFRKQVGQVKTVNTNGYALVEFIDFHKNTGWYPIDVDFLKVVDKPQPKEKPAPAKKRPAGKVVVKLKAAGPAGGADKDASDSTNENASGNASDNDKENTSDNVGDNVGDNAGDNAGEKKLSALELARLEGGKEVAKETSEKNAEDNPTSLQ